MARNKESERRERRSDKGQGQTRAVRGRWDCSVSREREKDGWTRAQLACTEEKQNLRGIINHSGLSTVVLSHPSSLLTSYTPSSARPEWQGSARHARGYIRIVEDGYNLFCIKFRVRKVWHARFALFVELYIRIRVVFSMEIYRTRCSGTFRSLLRRAFTSRVKY